MPRLSSNAAHKEKETLYVICLLITEVPIDMSRTFLRMKIENVTDYTCSIKYR